MSVRIRLARGGSKGAPFHKIVVADQRAPRDGRFIERVGSYNPLLPAEHAERIVVKADRVKYWLGVGAQPTERVAKLLSKMGLCAAPVINERPQKSAPKAKAQERAKAKAEAAAAAAEAAAAPAEAAEPAEA
ncbi:MAG: 30S ribosomal protein S16 [Alphaproteobacteria bacterium]|nr:30S ribosomal protein S16 [Alphaproteobacteria bacterium]